MLLMFWLMFLKFASAQTSFTLSQADIDLINCSITDKRHGIMLVSETVDYDLKEIKKYIDRGIFINRVVDENNNDISDSIKLSPKDRKLINKQLKTLRTFKWIHADSKKLNLKNISLISFDSSISNSYVYAIKYHIIPPIYFHNNEYCILSFSYNCGPLCGHGQITIYKRTGNGWRKWNHLSLWDE